MQVCEIRGVKIGEGRPKIIVPIVERNREAIIEKAQAIAPMANELVEWRVDFYEEALTIARVLETLQALRRVLGEKGLLFTFRTHREGGEREISPKEYTQLNQAVAQSGLADLIDVEMFMEEAVVKENLDQIHGAKVAVVGSYHDFHQTPPKEEIISRLMSIQEQGADIAKIAVMPQSPGDVLTLLTATYEMYTQFADRPIITMAMDGVGILSRIAGEVFGSAATFGAVGKISAPGQLQADQLAAVLTIIHQGLDSK